MKNLSVTTFVHILFTLTIAVVTAMFIVFHSWNSDRQKIEEFKRYQLISITFLSNLKLSPTKEELKKLYRELRVKPIPKKKEARLRKIIQQKGKTIFTGGSKIGKVRVFDVDGKRYIFVQRMLYNLMLEDRTPPNHIYKIAIGIGVVLIGLLLLLYLAVLKKLSPLKKLHKQIQRFAQGDMNVTIEYRHNDEIGKIAKSFDDAIRHINHLSRSKNLFMRNMMHELKTPITKGRIAVEMVEEETTRNILIRAFDRMNELISELAEMERVTMQSFEPNFEYVMLSEVMAKAQELLMDQTKCLKLDISDIALTTDVKLMALVLKNLIDNGMKYGEDKCVLVRNRNKTIEIVSKGKALEHPIEYYTEPFSQAEKRSSGFGLGLYIVHTIVEKLGYKLVYRHEAGENIFALVPQKR